MENSDQISLFNEEDVNNSVDKKKLKPIIIKLEESMIESNLAELPFINYYKSKEPIYAIEYLWHDNKGGEFGLEVRGSKHGIPSSNEFDTLLALFKILAKKNPKIMYDLERQQYDVPIEIEFTYRELARELGYSGYGGSIHAKLVKSIETLMDTTIYNKASGGLLDISSKKRVTNSKVAFHIIEQSQEEYSYNDTTNKFHEKAKVKINNFFYQSMKKGYLTKYNDTLLIDLKSDIAKKIMLILVKWKNKRKNIPLYYETLYQRIPLPDTKPVFYRNKRIKEAAEELKKVGFIEDFIVDSKNKKITFVFDTNSSDATDNTSDSYCALDKYNNFKEILDGMRSFGLTDEEIEGFDLKKLEHIKALLRYCYVKDQYGEIGDKHEYFSTALNSVLYEDKTFDKKWYD